MSHLWNRTTQWNEGATLFIDLSTSWAPFPGLRESAHFFVCFSFNVFCLSLHEECEVRDRKGPPPPGLPCVPSTAPALAHGKPSAGTHHTSANQFTRQLRKSQGQASPEAGGGALPQGPDLLRNNILEKPRMGQPSLYFPILTTSLRFFFFSKGSQFRSIGLETPRPLIVCPVVFCYNVSHYIHILIHKMCQDNEKSTSFHEMTKTAEGQVQLHFYY